MKMNFFFLYSVMIQTNNVMVSLQSMILRSTGAAVLYNTLELTPFIRSYYFYSLLKKSYN